MDNDILNKPIMMLSVGELLEVLTPVLGSRIDGAEQPKMDASKKYVYGVAGLAKILGCSISTAQRRISSGKIDQCIIRTGRIIMIDRDAVLEMMKESSV